MKKPALIIVQALCALSSAVTPTDVHENLDVDKDVARQRGPEIFNAVHDAMRQWGSSVHHNGMSLFLATVPEGVLLHHGNNRRESPTEPDWLAYEIEHAEGFARGRRGPPGGPPGGPPDDPQDDSPFRIFEGSGFGGPPAPRSDMSGPQALSSPPPNKLRRGQRVLSDGLRDLPTENEGGWLHVYRTTTPLQLLYIDGMGGAKTKMGTLDTQDLLLRGLESSEEDRLFSNHAPGSRGGGPMDEKERALDLCKLCQVWGLQGVIRMEAGFEIIKCDFSESLEQIQVLQRPDPSTREGHREALGNFEYMRGVAARYQGIGSSRTVIDYSSMVSAFFFPINLTNTDPSRPDLPRLSSTSAAELVAIKSYLDAVVGERKDQAIRTIDWQDISDLIVGRYADRIQYMAQKVTSVDIMVAEVNFLLDLYIDYSEKPQPDLSAAIQRCTNFYLQSIVPLTESDHLLQAAFTSVSSKICTSLFEIRQLVQGDQAGEESPLEASVRAAADLMHVLGWSRFKQCSGCDVDMVCLIPMWPFGSVDNYYNPHCTNGSDAHHGGSYWEGPGRGNGPPPRMTERWTPWAPWL